jgi:hypothetical protein
MNIIANLQYLISDADQSIRAEFQSLKTHVKQLFETELETISSSDFYSNIKNVLMDVINIPQVAFKTIINHYPKTFYIAIVIDIIVTVIFPSILRLPALALDLYVIFKYSHQLSETMRIYNKENVSEWTSDVLKKQRIIAMINSIEQCKRVMQNIKDFFTTIFTY